MVALIYYLIFKFIVMPLPALAGAAIAAGASLLGTGGQIYAAGKMNRKTREWNEKMYGQQRADALQDWNTQNAYNSPEQQMQRLKEAGLNPNLVYGTGADTTAGPVRSTESKSWSPSVPDMSGIGQAASGGLQAYQDITLQQEQVKNLRAQRANMELDSVLKTLDAAGNATANSRSKLELDKALALKDTAIGTANARLDAINIDNLTALNREQRAAAMHAPNLMEAFERVAKMAVDTKVASATLDNLKRTGILQGFDITLRKLGISPSDPLVLRALAQLVNGAAVSDIVRGLQQEVRNFAPGDFFKSIPAGMSQQFKDLFSGKMFE